MSIVKKTAGATLATAAAAMFAMGVVMTPVQGNAAENVKCFGVNGCKGQGACKTAVNACKGMNSCKGQGFLPMTEAACDKAGGKAG
ncbi:MAG: BufA2 family periplasmic bufferin-type metallophore [Alphaproteobacteria bacterium]